MHREPQPFGDTTEMYCSSMRLFLWTFVNRSDCLPGNDMRGTSSRLQSCRRCLGSWSACGASPCGRSWVSQRNFIWWSWAQGRVCAFDGQSSRIHFAYISHPPGGAGSVCQRNALEASIYVPLQRIDWDLVQLARLFSFKM